MVSRGNSGRGDSQSAQKKHAQTSQVPCDSEVGSIQPVSLAQSNLLTFSSCDLQGIHLPYDDPLVVMLTIVNYLIKRVLIDIGSSSDVLFTKAFDQLKIFRDRLRPIATPLVGFNGSSTKFLGVMELPVLMGTYPQ